MPTVTSRQLDQFLIDGGGLFVTRDSEGKVVDCRIAPNGDVVYLGIFAVYEKAGLVMQSADHRYIMTSIGRERIGAYSGDARFTKRKRLTTDQDITNAFAQGPDSG